MTRRALVALVATVALSGGAVALSQTALPTHRVTFGDGATVDGILPITIDTIPAGTTTTEATTTTVAPTTTLPATIDQGTLQNGEGYAFTVNDLREPAAANEWWSANYFFELPYTEGYGWGAGDRCRYRGQYGILLDGAQRISVGSQFDLDGGTPIGRVYFVRTIFDAPGEDSPTGAYIQNNDSFMREGSRHFDGTEDRNASTSPEPGFDECQPADQEYEPYTGPSETPKVVFRNGGEIAEIRDYDLIAPADVPVRFRVVDADGSDGRVAVAAYGPDNQPGEVVYYDALGSGSVELVP